MQQQVQDASIRVADSAAAGSITAAAWVNLADINTMVQIGAGVAAIIAGLAAAAFHIYKLYDLKRCRDAQNKEK